MRRTLIAIAVAITLGFIARICFGNPKPQPVAPKDTAYFGTHIGYVDTGAETTGLEQIEIDGCQYIVAINDDGVVCGLAHRGDCYNKIHGR